MGNHKITTSTMFLEIHAIQTLPPSNPNRGKNGDIKTATYGGVLRSRMSSQSQKRSARQWYQQYSGIERSQFAQRSKLWHQELAPRLSWASDEHRENIARLLIAALNASPEKLFANAIEPGNLLFLADHEIEKLAVLAEKFSDLLYKLSDDLNAFIEYESGDKKVKFSDHPSAKTLQPLLNSIVKNLVGTVPGDIALFGRMMATLTETSVDGSVQVAHALSVNACPKTEADKSWRKGEIDFFSAIDDMQTKADSGAGMIGEISYHAPTHYRYANIAVHEVVRLMGDKNVARASIDGFINGFIRSLPSGYSRQFAHGCLPEFVMLQVREGCPYSLISAFEQTINEPVAGLSISQLAVNRLLDRRRQMLDVYGDDTVDMAISAITDHYAGAMSFDDAIAKTLSTSVLAET